MKLTTWPFPVRPIQPNEPPAPVEYEEALL